MKMEVITVNQVFSLIPGDSYEKMSTIPQFKSYDKLDLLSSVVPTLE
jgi:hypothetical protein